MNAATTIPRLHLSQFLCCRIRSSIVMGRKTPASGNVEVRRKSNSSSRSSPFTSNYKLCHDVRQDRDRADHYSGERKVCPGEAFRNVRRPIATRENRPVQAIFL